MSLKSKVDALIESSAKKVHCTDDNCPCRDLDNIARENLIWNPRPVYTYERRGVTLQIWHGSGFRIIGGFEDSL